MDFQVGMTGAWWGPLRFTAPNQEALEPKPARCPKCWSRDCAAGLPSSRLDRFMLKRRRVTFECRKCGRRFRHFHLSEWRRMSALMDRIDAAIAAGAPVDRFGLPPRTSTG